MNTNIKIHLTDAERSVLSLRWFDRRTLVSRKEVNDFVQTQIQVAIDGVCPQVDTPPETVTCVPTNEQPFTPSRGDEPYLYRPQDTELAAKCSAVLDGLEYIEKYAWDTLERNRQ